MTGWQKLRSEAGAHLKLFDVRFDYLRNPRNGKTAKVTVLESAHSANIVAHTPEGNYVMVRQYRFGIGDFTTELPGGLVDEGEPPLQAAQRELREETGYTSKHWQYLGHSQANPVFMDSYIHHFYCKHATLSEDRQLDEEEDIQVLLMTAQQIQEMWQQQQLLHPHVIVALLRAGLLPPKTLQSGK